MGAGCSVAVDSVGERVFEDVNVSNDLGWELRGSVTVVDPAGDTVLDEPFEIPSTDADESNFVTDGEVWTEPGSYEVAVELANVTIEGTSRASTTATVDDVADEMVLVGVGSDPDADPVSFRVGESFSDCGGDDPG